MKLAPQIVEALVMEHYAGLYRFALSLARNEAEAADLTQQTCFHLASRGGQIRDLSKAKSWLFTTLRREFFAMRRQSGRFAPIDEEASAEIPAPDDVELETLARADAALVMDALGRVSEVFRMPLALFYLEDLSYREIAEILEVPVGTVMSRLSRGKSELRAGLARLVERGDLPGNVLPIDGASAPAGDAPRPDGGRVRLP